MSFDEASWLEAIEPRELEAVVDTMVLAAAADGEIGSAERDVLAHAVVALVGERQASGSTKQERASELVERAIVTQRERGTEAMLAEVRERLPRPESRRAAFGLAARVTFADGIVRTSEREALLGLAESLELDPDDAADLVRSATRPSV